MKTRSDRARPATDAEFQKHLKALKRSLPRTRTEPRLKSPARKGRWARRLLGVLVLLGLMGVVLPPLYWPVSAPVSSGFLFRLKPDSVAWRLEIHRGIDLAAPRGTVIRPTALGIVGASGTSAELGHFVRVVHLFGVESVYGHLDRRAVRAGDLVVPGLSTLGTVGSTGRATGPHLHFGVFWLGVPLPPDVLLVPHSLRKALVGF